MKHKKLIIILSSIVGFFLVCFIVFLIYAANFYHSKDIDSYLVSDDKINVVDNGSYIAFEPESPKVGIILYPGAKVEYSAYAPLLRSISEEDILTVVVHMPFNFAFFGMNKADEIISKYENIESWYLAGHSLGGAMAASYISSNASKFDGLILLAAYSTADLTNTNLKVLNMYGSNDNVLKIDKVNNNHSLLPSSTIDYVIEGGCHAYFASYGAQKGDGSPTITLAEQTKIAKNEIVKFIKEEL